jgi:hypothetical protein
MQKHMHGSERSLASSASCNGDLFYRSTKPCKLGHGFMRYASTLTCVRCAKDKASAWKHENKSKAREISRKATGKWKTKKPSYVNPAYAKRDKAKSCESASRQRAKNDNRYPLWADKKAIKVFYEIRRRVTECTGVQWEVDHILPLNGRLVSGLHVHQNLQVIPRTVNRKKWAHCPEVTNG